VKGEKRKAMLNDGEYKVSCRTEPTQEEINFCNKLRRLLKQKPRTMQLFADGELRAVDVKASPEGAFESLSVAGLGACGGGDPWRSR